MTLYTMAELATSSSQKAECQVILARTHLCIYPDHEVLIGIFALVITYLVGRFWINFQSAFFKIA